MLGPGYLRQQAATCLRWSRDCYDLDTAKRLRLMAEEFMAKADTLEAGPGANGGDEAGVPRPNDNNAGSTADGIGQRKARGNGV
jgi:hypothetical protein